MGGGALVHVEAALAKVNHQQERERPARLIRSSGSEEAAFYKKNEEMPRLVLCVIPIVKGVTGLALPAPSHVMFRIREVNTCVEAGDQLRVEPAFAEESHQEEERRGQRLGILYPEGVRELQKAWSDTTVRAALEPYGKYLAFFDQVKQFYDIEGEGKSSAAQSIEDVMYQENVHHRRTYLVKLFTFG